MKKVLLIILFFSLAVQIYAQEGKLFTLEDAVTKSIGKIYPKSPYALNIDEQGEYVSFIDTSVTCIKIMELKNGKIKPFINKNEFKRILTLNGFDSTKAVLPYKITLDGKNVFRFWRKDSLLEMNVKSQTIKLIFHHSSDYDIRFLAPDNNSAVLVRKYNLFLTDRNGEEKQLTEDGSKDIRYGEHVHRREFGIQNNKGVFWSPKSNRFAFYRKDQSAVTDYPYIRYNELPMGIEFDKYPMAGGLNHFVQIGIYDVKNEKITYLDSGDTTDVYLANLVWDKKGENLFVAKINRDQNKVDVIRYSLKNSWKPELLFTETDSKWIEPENAIIPLKTMKDKFLWLSQKEGFYNLYLYDFSGKLIEQVTAHHFPVTSIIGEAEKEAAFYYKATGTNPLEKHIFRLDLKTLKHEQITGLKGSWRMIMNRKGKTHILSHTSSSVPHDKYIYRKGRSLRKWYQAPDPSAGYAMPNTKYITLKASDGSNLYGFLMTPPDMDKSAKYPVIIYVYGGPHSQLVQDRWITAGAWLYYMSQHGYIVYIMDNHGTYNRGKEFAQAIYRQCGAKELEDQLTGVKFLKSLPYVDTTRIGVHGWSYGGFMTLTMLTRAPQEFKVGIAGAPVVDWKYYETVYTERYMDTPETNGDGYANASILNHIENLQGKLLVLHGTEDHTVVWQHTIQLLNKAIQEGTQLDYFIFPGQFHGMRGKSRIYLYRKMTDYFNTFLKR